MADLKEKLDTMAEFMGYEYIKPEDSCDSWGWWKKGTFNEGSCSLNNPNFVCVHSYELKYNTSLDALKPVFDKFRDSIITLNNKTISELEKRIYRIGYKMLYSPINEAFDTMYDSIIWLNEQKH